MSIMEKFLALPICETHGKTLSDECDACKAVWKKATEVVGEQFDDTDAAGEALSRAGGSVSADVAMAIQISTLVEILVPNPLDRVVYEGLFAENMGIELRQQTANATTKRLHVPNGGRLS